MEAFWKGAPWSSEAMWTDSGSRRGTFSAPCHVDFITISGSVCHRAFTRFGGPWGPRGPVIIPPDRTTRPTRPCQQPLTPFTHVYSHAHTEPHGPAGAPPDFTFSPRSPQDCLALGCTGCWLQWPFVCPTAFKPHCPPVSALLPWVRVGCSAVLHSIEHSKTR